MFRDIMYFDIIFIKYSKKGARSADIVRAGEMPMTPHVGKVLLILLKEIQRFQKKAFTTLPSPRVNIYSPSSIRNIQTKKCFDSTNFRK